MKQLYTLLAGFIWMTCSVRAFEPGDVVAYSIRAATDQVRNGSKTSELEDIAGITRFAGFVYDATGQDIILIGKVLPQKPRITLSDLVTGLKSRLVYNEWPLVSIDPTTETETTRQQTIRLEGHISDTQWGRDFIYSDVALKQFCLKLLDGNWPIRSYRDYVEDAIRKQAQLSGTEVEDITWVAQAGAKTATHQHLGQGVLTNTSCQCRFWFYATKRQRSVYEDGVFCIKELRLGVQPDERGALDGTGTVPPGDLFAQAFSDTFDRVSVHEPLSRLKGLYDLTAIAEAIRQNDLQTVVTNLIMTYQVATADTPTNYPLEELIGVVKRADGLPQLVRLSGGVDFRAAIKYLQGGDVTPLRSIVTKSRPNTKALAWRLPLDKWEMPNVDPDDQEESRPLGNRDKIVPGCGLAADSVVFQKPDQSLLKGMQTFAGFQALGGVSFNIHVDDKSFEHDTTGELKQRKQNLLKSRTDTNSLGWDVK